MLDSTVLGGTFTPSLSLGGGVVRNFFLPDRTQHQDLFALPPSSKLAIALGIGAGLPGLPRWLEDKKAVLRRAKAYHCLGLPGLLHLAR